MSDDTPSVALPDAQSVGAADGQNEAVEPVAGTNAGDMTPEQAELVKNAISQTLGKQYPTAEAALKAIKETQSFVGKAGKYQKVAEVAAKHLGNGDIDAAVNKIMSMSTETPNVNTENVAPSPAPVAEPKVDANLAKEVAELRFISENPDLKNYLPTLRELQGSTGKTLDDVAKSDIFQKIRAADEAESTRKVLQSNPRLGGASDVMNKARELVGAGNTEAAGDAAINAVIGAFGLGNK